MEDTVKIQIFEDAFRSGVGHSRFMCPCGKEFYNSSGLWDWDDEELEALDNSSAIDLDYTVSTVSFEGKEYCMDCDCWHKRALVIYGFLVSHNNKIIDFFTRHKKHKQSEVDEILTNTG